MIITIVLCLLCFCIGEVVGIAAACMAINGKSKDTPKADRTK